MLMVWLKKQEEFQKVCRGKVVFFSVEGSLLHYFSPARVNETDILYAFHSKTPLPFREHYDLHDEEGIHVYQLMEVDGLYCLDLDLPKNVINSGLLSIEEAEAY